MQTTLGPGATRRLLKRLRDMMAAAGSAQQRLDRIVKIIAADLIAEVCSVYVMRAGQVLELFATEGLKQDAVHKTRLRVGEGLVGEIAQTARTLALSDAQSHPNFAYRPETGEEIYHSMLGVPILRAGRALGVLVLQNRTFRDYTEEEAETLQTVAMVLAELVSGGELISPEEMLRGDDVGLGASERLDGLKLNEGIAIGTVVLHQPRVTVRQMVADDPQAEVKRLRDAMSGMRLDIDRIFETSGLTEGDERWEILETYRMFAEDRGWLKRISEAIETGLTAEAAVQKVQEDNRARLSQTTDPYLRERVDDFDDLANRLMRHLSGDRTAADAADLPDDTVLVARNLGPAELLEYDRRKLKGVVLEEGSPTAHVSIIAHALDLPMVGRVSGLLGRVESGDGIVVDGISGQTILRPRDDVRETFALAIKQRDALREGYAAIRKLPAVTKDGTPMSLNMNAGLVIDVDHLADSGADGIGLYRTEIPFMIRSSMPDVVEQTDLYRRILDRADGRPVVFRTLDIGGDKLLPYMEHVAQENPAMGFRAIRLTLDRPAIMREQVRGLLRAAGGRRLDMMFPMVAEVAEFDAARELVEIEITRERKRGRTHFVNYCLNCHSANYMRYNRLKDIGLTDQQILDNLVFNGGKVGDLMKIAMDPKEAKDWFGGTPPELSLIARSRASHAGSGADWLYSYLRAFYRDAERPTGWNNTVFPNVGMPHVLWELQGEQVLGERKVQGAGYEKSEVALKLDKPGTLSPAEYDQFVADLVNFLVFMAEPGRASRETIGMYVLLALGLLFVLAYALKKEYWKDVH